MEPNQKLNPLIVILGATASGKSEIAQALSRKFNGEIIAADSRTVYTGLDIGTDKPSAQKQSEIRHYLIDWTTPDKPITVADFKLAAIGAIETINNRSKLPILVGGSGLYIDAVIYNFNFRSKKGSVSRKELEKLSVEELGAKIKERGMNIPSNDPNPRHLIRLIESGEEPKKDSLLRPNTLLIGLDLDADELKQRIVKRVNEMFSKGLEREVKKLTNQYGWQIEPLKTIGYREFQNYFKGDVDLEKTKELIVNDTVQYAKRQKTWFKRNKDIHWVNKQIQAVELVTTFLNK